METPVTLLNRIRDQGQKADWERFASLYYPLVLSWSWRACGSYHDALDLTQIIFLKLHQNIAKFQRRHSGSLRGWLRRILQNELADLRSKKYPDLVDFNEVCEIQSIRRSGSPEAAIYENLFQSACALARPEFSDHTWEMFDRTFIQGQEIDAVSRAMGCSKNALYVTRTRVLRRLREILLENHL